MIQWRGKLPFVHLEGTPEEIGFQHGRALADRVKKCYEYYTNSLFGDHSLDLRAYGLEYLEAIRRFRPAYAEEIEGLAEGAGMRSWQIAVINARTEIYHRILSENLANECTALFFREARIVGQNWDWMAECEDFMAVVRIARPDGRRILMFTEAGIIGKIGFNDRGLAVCLNILSGTDHKIGAPVHILLRAMLDADSLRAAWDIINKAPSCSFSNIFAVDANGETLNVELAGPKLALVSFENRFPLHTNHYLSEDRDDKSHPIYLSSSARYARALELAKSTRAQTVESMRRLLGDTANGDNAICTDYAAYFNFRIGTVSAIIINLKEEAMWVAEGNPLRNGFQQFNFIDA